ncbi:Dynein regulatory complex subunit 3 [Quaeritorhiza haematococci]|nr:Dynein regulatory complex subunit 3 [Quaeritorhiza haematococci]
MSDKDALVNAVNGSHDFRLGKLDHQEDTLLTGVQRDLAVVIQRIHDDEVERNRKRVAEIIAYLDKCQNEIEMAEELIY